VFPVIASEFSVSIIFMLLVVFGAGASYDSDPYNRPNYPADSQIEQLPPIEQHRPPLSNRLFDHRPQFIDAMNMFSDCKPLIPHLRRAGVAVEQELARFQKEAESYPGGESQLAAIRYYLRKAIWECQNRWRSVHAGVTNYLTFLDEIERWRMQSKEQVCFATFNYDTMLEEAMEQLLHLKVDSIDRYYSWPNYSLFKLHGSVDWGRVVQAVRRQGRHAHSFFPQLIHSIRSDSHPDVLGEYQLCTPDMEPKDNADVVLYPALSIPLHQKDEFSCPIAHVTQLEAILPTVTKIITIGWRGAEQEFLRMLKLARKRPVSGIRRAMRLLVITASVKGAEETTKNIFTIGGDTPEVFHSELFQQFQQTELIKGFSGLVENWTTLRAFLQLR
jgi:hypothetical protein